MAGSSNADADSSRGFTAEMLKTVLANHEVYGLTKGVWFALDAEDALITEHAAHTLAGRLGLSSAALDSLAKEAKLYDRVSAIVNRLLPHRTESGPLVLSLQRPQVQKLRTR